MNLNDDVIVHALALFTNGCVVRAGEGVVVLFVQIGALFFAGPASMRACRFPLDGAGDRRARP